MFASSCELELSLQLGSAGSCASPACSPCPSYTERRAEDQIQQQQQQKQQIMFYGGQTCVLDVQDVQARAILSMAKVALVEDKKNEQRQQQYEKQLMDLSPCRSPPSSRSTVSQLSNSKLSMKQSLQRFLQKRKTTIDAASPYSIQRNRLPSLTLSSETRALTS